MATQLALANYSRQLRLAHADIVLLQYSIMAKLAEAPITAELLDQIAEDTSDLRSYKERYRQVIDDEIENIERLNRPAEAVAKEEMELKEELNRVNQSINRVLSKSKTLQSTFDRARNRDSLLNNSSTNTAANCSFSSSIKLPKVSLPTFDGDVRNFIDFKNLFENLIHNMELSNVQKLYYLKKALIADAAKLVKDYEMGDNAFPEIWAGILKRYENKRMIIHTLFTDVMNIKPAKTESEIRGLMDSVESIRRALKINGIRIDGMSEFFSFFVIDNAKRLGEFPTG